MTIKEATQFLSKNLSKIYDDKEAANIAELIVEKITALKKVDRLLYKQKFLNEAQLKKLHHFLEQLIQHKPVQYVLHEAWFAGMSFYVDEHVLIPRPETEELAEWIIKDFKNSSYQSRINMLDVGTGSGCIAIALKKKLMNVEMNALDISKTALEVAQKNAALNNVIINFIHADIIKLTTQQGLSNYNIIVSNPPYITKQEASAMNKNVLMFEPHEALFVPDENPLLFYDVISNFALHHLTKNGLLYFEINESYADEVAQLLHQKNFTSIQIKKDLQGKNRMIKAVA